MAMHGKPRHNGNLRGLQEALGDVFVHGDRGAEHAGADERESGEIEQALNGAVFAEGAVHHGKDHVQAMPAAAAVQRNERGVGWIGGHGNALASAQNFRKQLLRASANEPVAFLGDANRNRLVLIRIEAANHGSGGSERDFMLAGAAAEENANAKTFFLGSHNKHFFRNGEIAKAEKRREFPEGQQRGEPAADFAHTQRTACAMRRTPGFPRGATPSAHARKLRAREYFSSSDGRAGARP